MSHYTMHFQRVIRLVYAYVIVLLVAGCAVHPIIDNVTPMNTVAVVRKIRCEARNAIKSQGVWLLRNDKTANEQDKIYWSRFLEENVGRYREVPLLKFSQRTRDLIDKYDDAFIYFDFTFTMTEDNNLSTDISLLSTLRRGSDALNITASNNRKRQNVRNFRVQDTFFGLLKAELICDYFSDSPDYLYPVTGEIGISEVVSSFLILNESRALRPSTDKARLFADTLTFTTTITGSTSPTLTLSPISKALSLASIGGTATASRSDMHSVIIGLSLPEIEVSAFLEEVDAPTSNVKRLGRPAFVQSKSSQGAELDNFMDFQIRKNILMNAVDARPIAFSLF